MRKAVLSLLLWTWTGTTYFFVEVVFKTLRGRPETISWTMLALAILLAIPLERFGAELPWDCPLWLQVLICGTAGVSFSVFSVFSTTSAMIHQCTQGRRL